MKIDINTKMITLLGKPLGQSFAARMQNAGYEAAGLNMLYFYTEVDKDHLGDVVNGLRYMNFAGFAVTKPNKVRVLRYLDELDPLCKKMAPATPWSTTPEGKLIGYNTDGRWLLHLPGGRGQDQRGGVHLLLLRCRRRRPCYVQRAGLSRSKKIYITDFYEPCAESLVMDINENFAPVAELVHHGDYAKIAECNVVMNASGIGMAPPSARLPCPWSTSSPVSSILTPATTPTRPSSCSTRRRRAARCSTVWACPCIRVPHRSNCGLARKPCGSHAQGAHGHPGGEQVRTPHLRCALF